MTTKTLKTTTALKALALTLAIAAMTAPAAYSQVENRALQLPAGASVDCGNMPGINNLDCYAVQFWMNPSTWTEGATLLSRGNDFSVKLGAPGTVIFNVGDKSFTTTASSNLATGNWGQVTLTCDKGSATAWVDNVAAGTGTLGAIAESTEPFTIGGDTYDGYIDEIRIYDASLSKGDFGHDMETFDYFVFNTLNKWCPMWDNLVAYYKMDQPQYDKHLVEYKVIEDKGSWNNHGEFKDGAKLVAANNDKMPYLINSAYTENIRFFDRLIPREQYLMSNEVIILGADCFASDGHIETKTPNYHATIGDGAAYLPTFNDRVGVLALDGSDNANVVAPAHTLPTGSDAYSFETWLYIDEWTPGAMLLKKENDEGTEGIAVIMGDDKEKRLNLRINGKNYYTLPDPLPVGEWTHVAIVPGSATDATSMFDVIINGGTPGWVMDAALSDAIASKEAQQISESVADTPVIIGKGIKGKLDETLVWKSAITEKAVRKQMTDLPIPSITKHVSAQPITACYKYDRPEMPGFSAYSQDAWRDAMMSAFDGRAGAKVYIAVRGYYNPREPYGNWRDILGDKEKRARFASDAAALCENYDGVELDLEWIENNDTQLNDYGVLAKEIREELDKRYEDKGFRISLHNNYSRFPKNRDAVDGFTFQQYGPNANQFRYSTFTDKVQEFIGEKRDYSRDKVFTSFATTTSKSSDGGEVRGVRGAILEHYVPNNDDADVYDGYTYMGPMQVFKRARYTRDERLKGIFYWDMGNDNWKGTAEAPVMPLYNMAKYASYGINANVDTIITDLPVIHGAPRLNPEL